MEHKKISEFLIILTAQLKQKLDKFYLEEENPAREIGTYRAFVLAVLLK
jgi:hypothetical protein